jgi:DNA-binding IclR family transcriptional regulator
MARFALLSKHALVLVCIAQDRRARMRDLATAVDITERGAQRIVADLIDYGYITRTREGRRNRYSVRANPPMAMAPQRDIDIARLLTRVPVVRADAPPAHVGVGVGVG